MTPLPAKILVVRLGAIGDVANALVLAGALARHDPAVRIGWAVHPLARPLVEGHPAVSRVHLWPRGAGPAGLLRLARELRAERYDLAIDAQRIAKSALLARLSGAPRVLGFDRARCKEASWLLTRERIPPGDPGAHVVEQYLELALHLGVPAPAAVHELPADPAAEAWADAQVARWGGAPVLLNVGASKPANRWPAERFGLLARALRAGTDAPLVLTGGPDDRAAADAARAALGADLPPGVHDLVGATTLSQLVALARRARLLVGADTGPMHVAAAVGTPVVALFGPADPRRTGPWQGGRAVHRVLRAPPPPCAPCGRRTCDQPRHACMEDLDVALVAAEVLRALEQGAGAGGR